MENAKLDKEIEQLFYYHKQATTLEEEYTDEIYDYLVACGKIILTKEQKLAIFANAKRLYATDLNGVLSSGTLEEANKAKTNLRLLKIGELPETEKAKIVSLSKRLSIKEYFDKIDNLKTTTT